MGIIPVKQEPNKSYGVRVNKKRGILGYNNSNIRVSNSSKPSNEVLEHYRKLGEYYKRKYGV